MHRRVGIRCFTTPGAPIRTEPGRSGITSLKPSGVCLRPSARLQWHADRDPVRALGAGGGRPYGGRPDQDAGRESARARRQAAARRRAGGRRRSVPRPRSQDVFSQPARAVPAVPALAAGLPPRETEATRAFDHVHREMPRSPASEAEVREKLNAVFVNLSHRSQSLVERQLRLIEDLEHGEQDPQRRASLSKLNRLAMRMHRNSQNLLVVAGQRVIPWLEPAGDAGQSGQRRASRGRRLRTYLL